jgi:hypothetical protein
MTPGSDAEKAYLAGKEAKRKIFPHHLTHTH